MGDSISRQMTINAISSMFAPTPTQKDMVEDCLEIIENLPSVDAVEVVRCKDCRYFNNTFPLLHMCNISGMKMETDDFCSYGERKDG